MFLLVVWLPLVSAIIIGLFGRFLGDKGSVFLSCLNMFFTVLMSWFLFYEVIFCDSIVFIKLHHWIYFADLTISWGCFFDGLTVSMVFIVTLVSFIVHLYSSDYMSHDPYLACFMMYLSFFTFCMLILVTADNLLQMFVGWEGVGLCSFLLINFWTTRYKANFAALKAMIMNRIGDFMLILAIVLVWQTFGSLDYLNVFAQLAQISVSISDISPSFNSVYSIDFFLFTLKIELFFLIGFLVLLGAVSKSAQLGLHTWLPDAMEGPTPVSALIHAATMVTAGVFVLIRLNPIFEANSNLLFLIMCLGSLTAFFAGTVAIFQNDLKKVIAYSTCSQLGYMVYACGISNYSLALFHLLNHAFFKALLFLGSGVIIHALFDEQDMRKMGGLIKLLPFTYVVIFLGSIALMGFPFLTGFFSKDVLLELGSVNYFISGYFFYWLNVLAAFCTAYYSYRLLCLTFFMRTNSNRFILEHIHEATPRMLISLIVLAIGSIFFGFIAKDLYIGFGSDIVFSGWGYLPNRVSIFESEFLPFYIKNIPLFFSILGVFLCYIFSKNFTLFNVILLFENTLGKINLFLIQWYFFFSQKWFFDVFFKVAFMNLFLRKAYSVFLVFLDRGLFEIFGPIGLLRLGSIFANKCSSLQSSYLFNYIYLLIFNVVLCLYYGFVIFIYSI